MGGCEDGQAATFSSCVGARRGGPLDGADDPDGSLALFRADPPARLSAGSRQGQIVLAALHDASDVDVIATFETVLGAVATPSAAQR